MSFTLRRSTRAVALVAVATLALLFGFLAPAHAGIIACGDEDVGFYNLTNPSSQIHIVGAAPTGPIQGCQQYSDILTIAHDDVFLDTAGAYMKLSPRTACDVHVNGLFQTWRNYSYTSTQYDFLGGTQSSNRTYGVTLCNNF